MPLPFEKLKTVKHVVSHASCADGMASALILYHALGSDVKYSFHHAKEKKHRMLVAEPGMLFCDITPPHDRVQEFVAAGALVLDHHKQSESVVRAFGDNGVFADEVLEPGVSGATLAYREVWLQLVPGQWKYDPTFCPWIRDMATLAAIRDTWQRTSALWAKACHQQPALEFWPAEELFKAVSTQEAFEQKMKIGPLLYARQLETAKRAIEGGHRVGSHGVRAIAFNNTKATSDVVDMLGDTIDLVLGYKVYTESGCDDLLLVSTRSHTNFDCGAFCAEHEGGGHTRAAGFTIRLGQRNPNELLRDLIEAWVLP